MSEGKLTAIFKFLKMSFIFPKKTKKRKGTSSLSSVPRALIFLDI